MAWGFFTASGALKNAEYIGSEFPAGTIVDYAGASAPSNWLLCDGTAVSRTTYASLFAIIGTSYGSGDGSTTFNLPNATGKIIYATPGLKLSAPISSAFVTSLPSSPTDGQIIFYQSSTAGTGGGTTASMASIGAAWQFRYNASSSSSYKWEFVGGTTILDYVDATEQITGATYTDMSTIGPRVKAALAGEYSVTIGAGFRHNANGGVAYMGFAAGSTAAGNGEDIPLQYNWPNFASNTTGVQAQRTTIKAITANAEFVAKYKNNDPTAPATAYFDKRRMAVVPVRVG